MKHLTSYLLKELQKHAFDYLTLFTAGVFFLLALNVFRGEKSTEFIILLIYAALYIIWGIYHHIIEGTLHLKTVIEYILIAFTILFLLKIIIYP